jgi:hypothetical protein
MNRYSIICYNSSSEIRYREFFTIGVPFASGILKSENGISLRSDENHCIPLQTRVLSQWPNGSIKWLLCDFQTDIPALGEKVLHLSTCEGNNHSEQQIQIIHSDDAWRVSTGLAEFHIDPKIFRPFLKVGIDNFDLLNGSSEIRLTDDKNLTWTPHIDQLQIESAGPLRATLRVQGGFQNNSIELLRFEARLHFYLGTARSALEIRLHNPRAAQHSGNLWDLGDPASVILREWSLSIPLNNAGTPRLRLKTSETDDWLELHPNAGAFLYQESSGGRNWNSPIHRNRDGVVPFSTRGWRLTSRNELAGEGLRAQPIVFWESSGKIVTGSIDYFWQRFPKSVLLNSEGIKFSMLPEEFSDGHELQGGEQWTEILRIDFDTTVGSEEWGCPLPQARCAPDVYRASGIFTDGLLAPQDNGYKFLLSTVLDDQKGFISKRENVDEYGWRNFGDVYADHESAFYKGSAPFVSHYNNQYDVLYSLYRQYLAGGDLRWGKLARELALHVADIDLNHTDEDREEYCQGPFWHTDHYLDAGLSTHRMASREHLTKKNPSFCGGGPAAEHGYASGLALHYLMSGEPRYRDIAINLADWCWRSLNGPRTVGASLLRSLKYISRWRLEGRNKPIWPRFPFSRGTGNCLNITLDALDLTCNHGYLVRCEEIVQGTIHPLDDPEERGLRNAEDSWSYLVFLTALCRYLHAKREWDEIDKAYCYGVESLLIYSRWMVDNEYPYLDKPEILEYPNETWSGQDLRKGVVLYYASGYADGDEQQRLLERARFFLNEGVSRLICSGTYHYTRPLALVLQNGWALEALAKGPPNYRKASRHIEFPEHPTPHLTLSDILSRSLKDMLSVIPQTGLNREWRWLKSRVRK